ncbi:MAG: DNA polymerase III subunit alpha [Fimbriimonadaceae bacterium]|nr:DNA polymerase III subunit alpha [Fimbriimonadaceae bacterium]
MRTGGVEVLARWCEAGEWWAGAPAVEAARWRDQKGVVREARRELAARPIAGGQRPMDPTQREEPGIRPRKTRDEKVAKACGLLEERTPRVSRQEGGSAWFHVLSGYSFGRSVLLAREVPRRAASLGVSTVMLADRFSLTGAMEMARECVAFGVKPLIGSTFEMDTGGEVVLVARDKRGYVSLSSLVTECHLSEPRLFPLCTLDRLRRHSRGLLCLSGGHRGRLDRLLASRRWEEASEWVDQLVDLYGSPSVFLEVERSYCPWGVQIEARLEEMARTKSLVLVAGGPLTHAMPEDFPAQDVTVCADTLCTVDEVLGRKLQRHPSQPPVPPCPSRSLNCEQWLRSPDETRSLYRGREEWLAARVRLAEMCEDDVLPGRTRLPQLHADASAALHEATMSGAARVHHKVGTRLRARLAHELERICRLGFADHFLAIWDACEWARGEGIHFSGRGSVVDSAVAYCLGLSRIDAMAHDLHFDRFLPEDGSKRPDIDIDFEAARRDDVRSYFTQKYGKERVATVAAIGAYNTRGIVREVGKALGLSQAALGFIAKRMHGGVAPEEIESALERRPELAGSGIDKNRLYWLFLLARRLADVPRNMRAHSSGIVVSDRPIHETVPVQWSAAEEGEEHLRIIQWDKRSAKHCFDKFDILCLRGQDVLSGTERRIRATEPGFDAQDLGTDDEEGYRAMRSGELVGIPQSASPAMRQAHMRLRTTDLHDASLMQAGIRPGVGGAVKINELIARRRGLKPYSFEHPEMERIMGHTYGIIVFQEQVDQLLQTFAGYSSGEAEDTREDIHKRRHEGYGYTLRDQVVERVVKNGFSPSLAEHVFELVAGFNGYGFAQGHALAFAEISLRSIHCQQNYPAEFFASLLDAQPAGYYGPCTLVNEARSRGVAILPVDVERSSLHHEVEDCVSTVEPRIMVPNSAIRLSLRNVKGLSRGCQERVVAERGEGYGSAYGFVRRVRPARDELEAMVLCGALDSLHPHRRDLLWSLPALLSAAEKDAATLWDEGSHPVRLECGMEDFSAMERALYERSVLGLDVERHLVHWERSRLEGKGCVTAQWAKRLPDRTRAVVVGNPIRLRFPPTPSGRRVVFFDLEDETGLLNVTCFDETYRRDGHAIVCSPYVTVVGHAQWRDGHTAFLAQRVFPYRPMVAGATEGALPLETADFLAR